MIKEPTDWRVLCAELTDALHDLTSLYEGHECELVTRSRATLAQPEPEGPTDEEIERFADDAGFVEGHAYDECGFRIHDEVGFARAVLARWGRCAIEPVPVAERLPGAGDCDANELCWWWCHHYESWQLDHAPAHYRHWLPHHALPLPTTH